MTKWVSLIFILLIPASASLIACTEKECFQVSNSEFLQLDQPKVMEEITYQYLFACEILNLHPLGVFSGLSGAFLMSNCNDIKVRETLKFIVGVSIREDFEKFAQSSSIVDIKFSHKKIPDEFPTIQKKLTELDASIYEIKNKNSELEKSLKEFNKFQSRGFSGCLSLVEEFFKNLAKEGKKATTSQIKKWTKEAEK